MNLDYKLREELREELTSCFATGSSTVVYATRRTERGAAARRYTAVLDEPGLQSAPRPRCSTAEIRRCVARAFSDPPMNLMPNTVRQAAGACRG